MRLFNRSKKTKFGARGILGDQRGIAIVLAIFAMVLAVVIAAEISYETQVEYVSSSQSVNRLKAYYAAKSGVELSLFRILLFKKAVAQFGDQMKDNKTLLDTIWSLPFAWPPVGLDELNEVDREEIQTMVKESNMDAQFMATIQSEGGKIDLNDLGSDNKELSNAARMQLLQIFDNEMESNKVFKDKYDTFDFDKLANNIQDWVDEDTTSLNGGDESMKYTQPQEARNYRLPPNAPFKTLDELHMVADMEDEFFDLLKDKVTVYGTKGINVNYAPENVLRALDPQIKDEKLAAILKRRSDENEGGPFKGVDDFYGFLESKGIRTENMKKAELPLLFDAEHNFRIVSSGQASNVRREITAVTYDIDNLTSRFAEILDKKDRGQEQQQQPPQPPANPADPAKPDPKKNDTSKDKAKAKIPKGRPTVVLWQEG